MNHPTAVAIETQDALSLSFIDYDHGITAIDTGFERPLFDASHLLVEQGRAAFIDVGTNYSVAQLLGVLDYKGIPREAVDYVIVTHVHLDHAGGAGAMMAALPNARLVVHPRGARHMVDPTALVAGASAVYGADTVRRTYGELLPVAAERVIEAADGHVVDLAGRPLVCLDTPGHARHHLCVWDARAAACFTGDTFGISYRELDTEQGPFIFPTSTPVQFEPEAMKTSIARLLTLGPRAMFLTHYSRVTGVEQLAAQLIEQIDALVELAHDANARPERHGALVEGMFAYFGARAAAHGVTLGSTKIRELLALDVELNAQGLEVWLDRAQR